MRSSVSIVRCESYEEGEVFRGLRRAIDLIGGMGNFVRRGDRVLLKPNLLYGKAPEKAVTTHPFIVKGVIKIVLQEGGIPFIGDSPSIGSLSRAAEKSGIKRVADEMNCPLVEFEEPALPQEGEGKFFKQLEIDRAVWGADVIINLPKWKTHGMMLLTLGVKNLFGCIPGYKKVLSHLKAGDDPKIFARMLVDLYRAVQPSLTILDGVVGMEGNGPGSGDPIAIGLILAATDPLCLDQIVCDLLGIPRKTLLTNRVAFEQGMGRDDIEVFGEKVEEVRLPEFKFPPPCPPDWNLPGFLRRALKSALTSKPICKEETCESCDQCVGVCPAKALTRKTEGLVFDYGKCIRCFCCQEVCPAGAISIKPGWAVKLVNRQ
jgi:uncharacterized protein (DUF362 family)/Pyruvate/2-oxoacid:ferredoxin oxidoreductase delta subunit